MSKPLLSIGIIFKNDLRCIERCLKSLQPLREAISCEVVMADTGSEDGSRAIAERYADILIEFPWNNDFAAARNAVLDRTSGQWFMTLDTDEWLDPQVDGLVDFLQLPQNKYHLASYTIRNYKTPNVTNDNNFSEFSAMRVMRTGLGIRYEGCIHEHWAYPEGLNTQIVRLNALVYHDGYAFASKAAMQAKHDRNLALLKKKLDEDPDSLQTLCECIDTTKTTDEESADYARRALEVLHRDWEKWGSYGARTYRDAVSVAQLRKLPELLDWAEKALELYAGSIFVRVDVAYCAYARSWDNKDVEGATRWSEMYRKGLEDYRAGNFERDELFRGHLEFASPFWERRLLIMQVEGYLRLERYEDAVSTFACINGAELDEEQQVEACVNMLLRLYRTTEVDTSTRMVQFWEQINQPSPSENMAQKRKVMFINTAAGALTPHYRQDEAGRKDFKRHSYRALLPLKDKCALGDGAAILDCTDPAELEQRLSKYKWEDMPISAVAHALQCGMAFPRPEKPVSLEEMDALAVRLAPLGGLVELSAAVAQVGIQALCWKRALLLAAVRHCAWKDEPENIALAKQFVEMEKQFLPTCYTDTALTAEGVFMLPPMHRFGWYCVQAFDALDHGDAAGYVRLLRKGLSVNESMKAMVEFLLEYTPELREPEPSAELLSLAEQIRTVLANFSPEDPAVAALKQSEAYQKVAYLIEGAPAAPWGGLKQ